MASNPQRHVASGIEAVIDSAYIARASRWVDVWVDETDVAEAIREARKLGATGNEVTVRPSEVTGDFAIRIR